MNTSFSPAAHTGSTAAKRGTDAAMRASLPAWWTGPASDYLRLYMARDEIHGREYGWLCVTRVSGMAAAVSAVGLAAAAIDISFMPPPRLESWALLCTFAALGLLGLWLLGSSIWKRSGFSREYAVLWNELARAVRHGHIAESVHEAPAGATDTIQELLREDASATLIHSASDGMLEPRLTVFSEEDFRLVRTQTT